VFTHLDNSHLQATRRAASSSRARSKGTADSTLYPKPYTLYPHHSSHVSLCPADNTPHREQFTITPKGYYFRSRVYRRLDGIINDLKRKPHPDIRSTMAAADATAQDADFAVPPPPVGRLSNARRSALARLRGSVSHCSPHDPARPSSPLIRSLILL